MSDFNVVPQHIDYACAIRRGRDGSNRVKHNADHYDNEAPTLVGRLDPEAPHRTPGITRLFALFALVVIAKIRQALLFALERLTLFLFIDVIDGFTRSLIPLLFDLLIHDAHLLSSAIRRWRDRPRTLP